MQKRNQALIDMIWDMVLINFFCKMVKEVICFCPPSHQAKVCCPSLSINLFTVDCPVVGWWDWMSCSLSVLSPGDQTVNIHVDI